MNRNLRPLLLILLVIGLLTGAFIYYKHKYVPKYDWKVLYKKNVDQPYGLKLFFTAIKQRDEATHIIYNESYHLLDTNETQSNFIFIGNSFTEDSAAAYYVSKFAEKGNNVLICANLAPLEILRYYTPIGDSIMPYTSEHDSLVEVDFLHNDLPFPGKLQFHYRQFKDTVGDDWLSYSKEYFFNSIAHFNFVPIAAINDSNVTAFYIKTGKGKLIFHSNPNLFTNFYFSREEGFKHASNILSLLHKGPVYWDDPFTEKSINFKHADKNPLAFLFSHPNLRWGWYLFLFTVALYLIFRSKREQRIIPLLPKNTNSSIDYTKAIGTLYFQSRGHYHIANEMYHIFLSEIRSHYNMSTDIPEMDLIEQLSVRSGISKTVLYNLFKQFKYLRSDPDAGTDHLISLYDAVKNYHLKRK